MSNKKHFKKIFNNNQSFSNPRNDSFVNGQTTVWRADHYFKKDWKVGCMQSHDVIQFVIHQEAAANDMKAEDCWDIIENNARPALSNLILSERRT